MPKEPLEGFEKFEAWQTAGLNASNKLLVSPCQEQALDVALAPWPCSGVPKELLEGFGGFGVPKRAFGGFWMV